MSGKGGKQNKKPRPRKPMPLGAELTRRPKTAPVVPLPDPSVGRRIVMASFVGTGALLVTTVPATIDPGDLASPALVVALVMFFAGTAALIWSYFLAIGRSRESEIGLAGLYGLSGTAPAAIRVRLFGAVAAQVVIAIGGTLASPYSSLAFDFLAVMWGIGLTGLWGARHGAFPPRQVGAGRSARGSR